MDNLVENELELAEKLELKLAQKIEKYEKFFKEQWGDEKYKNVLEIHKNLLKNIHVKVKEVINTEADYAYTAEWVCDETENDIDLSSLQKVFTKGLFVLAGFYLEVESNNETK